MSISHCYIGIYVQKRNQSCARAPRVSIARFGWNIKDERDLWATHSVTLALIYAWKTDMRMEKCWSGGKSEI